MEAVKHVYFLPGMMCDQRLFSSQIATLSEFCTCHCIVATHGDSMQAYAGQVIADIQHVRNHNPAAKVYVLGLSMGGIIAMHCIKQAPECIDALVLMDTNPLAELPSRQALRLPQIRRALEGELDTILIEEMKPLYLAEANRSNDAILSLVLSMARDLGPDVFARQSTAIMNRGESCKSLSNWEKPALIIHGEADKLCPAEKHVLMHQLMTRSTLITIADAGHLPTLESPKVVNRHLVNFIRAE